MNKEVSKLRARGDIDPSLAQFEEVLPAVLSADKEPSADLFDKIMSAINARIRFYAELKICGFLSLFVSSLAGLFFAFGELARQLERAGTLKIFSLIFSDLGTVLANWQAFVFSFLESLPIIPFVSVLGGVLILLVSVRFVFDNLLKLNWHLTFKIKLIN